jgi:S1-C subfamily serine protease
LPEGIAMPPIEDALTQFSDALAARAAALQRVVAGLRAPGTRPLTATLWRADVAVASEQVFPEAGTAELVMPDGGTMAARVAGRDAATNIVALRLAAPLGGGLPAAGEARLGGLALAVAAGRDGAPNLRLAVVRRLGPAWYSLKGGEIDRRIELDLRLAAGDEGGPVFDAAGGLLGISTAGPRGRALVLPAATVERVLGPLLAEGRVARGWLGAGLHPVALPDEAAAAAGQDRGLLVLRLDRDGPAGKAGVLTGDVLLGVGEAAARHPGEIARLLGPDSIGRTVALRLLRGGQPLSLAAVVTPRPA